MENGLAIATENAFWTTVYVQRKKNVQLVEMFLWQQKQVQALHPTIDENIVLTNVDTLDFKTGTVEHAYAAEIHFILVVLNKSKGTKSLAAQMCAIMSIIEANEAKPGRVVNILMPHQGCAR